MPEASRRRLFVAVLVAGNLALAAGLGWLVWERLQPAGEELNRIAWQATFSERGLPVPPDGPREGYWGAALPRKVTNPVTGWQEAETRIAGKVEIDGRGIQRAGVAGAGLRILVLGGSVAFGAYASSLDRAYFTRLASLLEAGGRPASVEVFAAGGWWSRQERSALGWRIRSLEPDLVVMVNGLNDLTIRLQVPMDERVATYAENMEGVLETATRRGAEVLYVLQPFLPGKAQRSRLEERILALSVQGWGEDPETSLASLRRAVDQQRAALAALGERSGARFHDCSTVADAEAATSFTDLWHFTDPVHELLARCIAEAVAGRP